MDTAVAVGGSAASLRRLVGDTLDPYSLRRALGFLTSGPAADVAFRFDLDVQRVRLMPAGLLALDAAHGRWAARCRSGAAACARACCSTWQAM